MASCGTSLLDSTNVLWGGPRGLLNELGLRRCRITLAERHILTDASTNILLSRVPPVKRLS